MTCQTINFKIFQEIVFIQVDHIKYLNIMENPLSQIAVNIFASVPLNNIITKDFHVCCIAPSQVTCQAFPPWHTSFTCFLTMP